MQSCLIIINKSAGSADKISFDYVKNRMGAGYNFSCHTIPCDGEPDLDKYNALAVCGGDGTLSSILTGVYDKQKDVYYFPYGTLNDKAKTRVGTKHAVVGVVGEDCDTVFAYVFAAGSFTPIGYNTSVKMKKRFGVLAYLAHVIKEYKIHSIHAKVVADDKIYSGDFTLVMFIKSPRCFGFKFNRAYDEESESGHIVLIRSPKLKGLLGKIEMFFPFFKVFFLGLKKEREGKIVFKQIRQADLCLQSQTDFCKDGEKVVASGNLTVCFQKTKCNLNLMQRNKNGTL